MAPRAAQKQKTTKKTNKNCIEKPRPQAREEAPDDVYLGTKMAFYIGFGISGALRRGEFVKIKNEHVILEKTYMLVKILFTKNKVRSKNIGRSQCLGSFMSYVKNT
ncbi:hypothetical protein TKK_0012272 [Trichogramma kaykai]